MRKIIYYGISSDAPSLPSPFLPKFLELLHNTFDTLAAYGAFSTVNGNVVIIGRTIDSDITGKIKKLLRTSVGMTTQLTLDNI